MPNEKPEDNEVEQTPDYEVDLSKLEPQEHSFVQRGRYLVCTMPGHHHGTQLPPNKNLNHEGRLV